MHLLQFLRLRRQLLNFVDVDTNWEHVGDQLATIDLDTIPAQEFRADDGLADAGLEGRQVAGRVETNDVIGTQAAQ